MARLDVENIKKIEKQRNTVHEKVYTTYTVFENSGQKYVQLDTYGSVGRECQGKISQSIQIDLETAKLLKTLLDKEFCFCSKDLQNI